jgi:hypothetical protein
MTVFQQIQTAGRAINAAAALGEWLQNNRESLIQSVRDGAADDATSQLHLLCVAHPEMAGVVAWLMTADLDQAIASIGFYDIELSNGLRECRDNFARVRHVWRANAVKS